MVAEELVKLTKLKRFKKGAMIRWTHPIQRLSTYMHDPGEPDLNKWHVLEQSVDYNLKEDKIYLQIDGWSIPFSLRNAIEGFTVLDPTDLSQVLYNE